ncbi:MAG: hypothetical protein QM802_08180 [Agriterribacter sp.]
MRKALPYIIGAVLLMLIMLLVFGGTKNSFDQRITLNKKDKIPYGSYVAYSQLPHLFPHAKIAVNKKEPGYWEDSVVKYNGQHQAMIILNKDFNASYEDLKELFQFVSNGNDVFISSYDLSRTAQEFFHLNLSYGDAGYDMYGDSQGMDTLELSLTHPPFYEKPNPFIYPGRKYYSHFNTFDSVMSYVMERSFDSSIVLLRIRAGEGNFFIHTAPLAFSNYFLLHKENINHYNQLLSVLDPEATKVIWDEYFLYKPVETGDKDPSPLRVLMEQPSFRMALLTALAGIIIFILLGLKRRQRIIPVITPVKNDSLEFVKTIGRLYFQKRNNKNLCQKMGVYFTEYVHNQYKMNTGSMDKDFVARLSQKSGSSSQTIQSIADYISFLQETPAVHDQQVIEFYQLLEKFYKTS